MHRSTLHRTAVFEIHERADMLAQRAGRFRRRGEIRRAAVAMGQACALSEGNAARWMLLGHLHAQLGHRRAAEHAMKQALFLRERYGEARKARVIRRLIANFAPVSGALT